MTKTAQSLNIKLDKKPISLSWLRGSQNFLPRKFHCVTSSMPSFSSASTYQRYAKTTARIHFFCTRTYLNDMEEVQFNFSIAFFHTLHTSLALVFIQYRHKTTLSKQMALQQ
jgi:hypothetical protein